MSLGGSSAQNRIFLERIYRRIAHLVLRHGHQHLGRRAGTQSVASTSDSRIAPAVFFLRSRLRTERPIVTSLSLCKPETCGLHFTGRTAICSNNRGARKGPTPPSAAARTSREWGSSLRMANTFQGIAHRCCATQPIDRDARRQGLRHQLAATFRLHRITFVPPCSTCYQRRLAGTRTPCAQGSSCIVNTDGHRPQRPSRAESWRGTNLDRSWPNSGGAATTHRPSQLDPNGAVRLQLVTFRPTG